ncbi:MAG TPA: hypothetical protein VMA98_01730 [Candidatus Acidoferrales bacterium]|nr:hypothetical protein [Candidatus Acidoferrales bacterium]
MANSFSARLKSANGALLSLFSWLGLRKVTPEPATAATGDRAPLEAECIDLRARLAEAQALLKTRTELLYTLQQQYSSEHFDFQKCMRDLQTEEMRNAGAYAILETILKRARALQSRVGQLKERLRNYEMVEDEYFDTAPIRIEQSQSGDGP